MNLDEMTLDIQQEVEVKGKIDEVFKSVINRFGKGSTTANGESMQLNIEEFAGGRWYRDRGEGVQHLWGHVQVIKAPVLLELSGPMFMSYPALNHIELKLEEVTGGTKVVFRHRAVGMLEQQHREGVKEGWKHFLDAVQGDFAQAAGSPA
ncbi:MAG: SRPBCC domain-containing protein [Acidobacteriota bacterium]